MPVVGGEEPRALGAQRCVLGRGERRVGGEHCTGRVARVVDGGHVCAEVCDVQRRQTVLPVAEEVAWAALAQVGTAQDCTMLVTNALAANGIYYHGWPAGYMSLGTVTDDPQPGDLIYYADGGMGMAHIAVYIGNGQAVHGGYNGNETVVASAYLGSGPVFIHIG